MDLQDLRDALRLFVPYRKRLFRPGLALPYKRSRQRLADVPALQIQAHESALAVRAALAEVVLPFVELLPLRVVVRKIRPLRLGLALDHIVVLRA